MEKKKFIIHNKLAFYTGLIYFIVMALFVGLKVCAYFKLLNFAGADYFYKIVVQIGFMALLPLVLFPLFTKNNFKQTCERFSFRKISGKAVLISFALGICAFIIIGYISSLWSGFLSLFGYKFSSSSGGDYSVLSFILSIIFVGILPGICEEIAHRGLILGGTKQNGAIRSILLCGLLFGLMHFNPTQFGYAFVAGMLFSFVTLLTRSIFPAMIMHFTNNTLSTITSYSQNSEWFPSTVTDWLNKFFASGNTFLIIIFNFILITLTITIFIYLVPKLFTEGKRAEFHRFRKNLKKQLAGTELETEIDINNKQQIMEIYQQANFLNFEQKLKEGKIKNELNTKLTLKNTFELILSDDFTLPEKRKPSDYIFYYCAIFLGAAGTILMFILNLIS